MIRTFLEIFLLLTLPTIIVYIIIKLLTKRLNSITKELINILVIVYIVFLLYIVWLSPSVVLNYQPYNIIPFNSLNHYINDLINDTVPLINIVYNVLGNILLTLPIGLWLKYKGLSFNKTLIYSVFVPILIELGQYLLHVIGYGTRTVDIDDWILNFIGITSGYIIAKLISKIKNI